MMPYHFELETDQWQREYMDLAGMEYEASRNSDLQSEGEFDGKCNLAPRRPENHAYWCGFCVGFREYHLTQQNKLAAFEADREF